LGKELEDCQKTHLMLFLPYFFDFLGNPVILDYNHRLFGGIFYWQRLVCRGEFPKTSRCFWKNIVMFLGKCPDVLAGETICQT
jgi:hypothetical protein